MKKEYDYIVYGAGISGCSFARIAADAGYHVLLVERDDYIGGTCRDKQKDNYYIHLHGPHIFHTNYDDVWRFVNRFTKFNRFINSPIVEVPDPKNPEFGQYYNLPFNMNTFSKLFDVYAPQAVERIIEKEKNEAIKKCNNNPTNLEEQACCLVGKTIYETFIKRYTENQWGKPCTKLDSSIIKRIPIRYSYDNNYFDDTYQGIPIDGYTNMMMRMLDHPNIQLSISDIRPQFYNDDKHYDAHIIYTGSIDDIFDHKFGLLEYRSCSFHHHEYNESNQQGVAVMNHVRSLFTRSIEHKHFYCLNNDSIYAYPTTVISDEYPQTWELGKPRYYPINDKKNQKLYNKYLNAIKHVYGDKFHVLGRLGEYKYMDMDDCIKSAIILFEKIKNL